jgi:hypothetical protein
VQTGSPAPDPKQEPEKSVGQGEGFPVHCGLKVAAILVLWWSNGEERSQATRLPQCLDDYITEDNTVRVLGAVLGELNLAEPGFDGLAHAITGRPSCHTSNPGERCNMNSFVPIQR